MMKCGKGFSLVELMVVFVVGVFLFVGVSLFYLVIKSMIVVSKEFENV